MWDNNKTLNYLNLRMNNYGPEGFKHVCDALAKNCSAKHLNFSENALGDDAIVGLAEALKTNTTLDHLGLNEVQITAVGTQAIAEFVAQSNKINFLSILGNKMGVEGGMFGSKSALICV
jgi:Ran GTPase-activating protein (RanGAP) involved in mRNA processing and transport